MQEVSHLRVNTVYRTVILRAYPSRSQEKVLLRCEQSVFKFIGMSRYELQKLLYHKIKPSFEGSMRTLALLVQRFTGSMGNKAIIPFDEDNSRFIQDNGFWFVEIQAYKGRKKRIRIPIAKTNISYYDVIKDMSGFPFYLVRENDQWFVYVSIPVEKRINKTVVGVDFNFHKWVAASYEGRPLFFDVRSYVSRIDRIQRIISRKHRRGEPVNELYRKIMDLVKLAHGNFLSRIMDRWSICTLAIEEIDAMFKMQKFDSKMLNNWLYTKTAFRKFSIRAMAKGFRVVEVDPRDTSRRCHRCGQKGIIYGKHGRLFKCPYCGLVDYNRDLNAARNISLRGKDKILKEVW